VPELRRDLFPDENSWREAQAVVDAEALGMGSEASWHIGRVAADADALPPVSPENVREATAGREFGNPDIVVTRRDNSAMIAEDLTAIREHIATERVRYTELATAREKLSRGSQDEEPGVGSPYGAAARELGLHPLSEERIRARMDELDLMERAAPEEAARGVALREQYRPVPVDMQAAGGKVDIYADPAAPEMQMQADRLWHDLENDLEGDARPYHLNDGDQRTIAQVKEEFSAEAAAINAVRGCL